MAAADHLTTLGHVKSDWHAAGMTDGAADAAALRTIRQQMDGEVIASAFRDSFLMISIAFILASLPLVWIMLRRQTAPAR